MRQIMAVLFLVLCSCNNNSTPVDAAPPKADVAVKADVKVEPKNDATPVAKDAAPVDVQVKTDAKVVADAAPIKG
jgi:predicted component of type VI protein secretion system